MKKILKKKLILGIIGLLLALLILKGILLWTAKSKIIIDYVSEYNNLTCSENFESRDNAAAYYGRAIDNFYKMPNQVSYAIVQPSFESQKKDMNELIKKMKGDFNETEGTSIYKQSIHLNYIDWPTDFNEADQNVLMHWLAINGQAFEYFRTASRKPYYCLKRFPRKGAYLENIIFPETGPFRDVTEAMFWNAKLLASKGKFQDAFDDILTCYRAGLQKRQIPSFDFEQLLGMSFEKKALSAAINIIDRVNIDPKVLSEFQNSLQKQFSDNSCIPSYEGEKLLKYDILQRLFLYDKKGNGKMAWSEFRKIFYPTYDPYSEEYMNRSLYPYEEEFSKFKVYSKVFLCCLFGPTQNEIKTKVDETFAAYESAMNKTPWQLHLCDSDYLNKLRISCDHDCRKYVIWEIDFPDFYSAFNLYYRLKAQERALLTIIALHRFKAEKGKLPEKLDELVAEGFLQALPLDPYSDGALVYRVEGENFTLYSIGENFKDDGGFDSFDKVRAGKLTAGGKETRNPFDEIIFWPVKHLEKTAAESTDTNSAPIGP